MDNDTLTNLVIDCSTGEETVVPLSPQELQDRAQMADALTSHREAQEAHANTIAELKASAKAKLISGQPLTAEEADTLVL